MRSLFRLAAVIVVAVVLLLLLIPLPRRDVPLSSVVLDRDENLLKVFLAEDERWRIPFTHDAIPKKLVKSLLTAEDKRYFHHPGVDLIAVGRALIQDVAARRAVSGASTITMQVIRLLHPRPRTIFSKVIEALQALKLERILTKREILKLYFTHAPYGGNVVGVRAASLRYLGRDVDRLTWAQAALLVVLPRSPTRVNLKRNRPLLKKRRNLLLAKLHREKILRRADYLAAIAEPLPRGLHPMPGLAPHLSVRLNRYHPGEVVYTTLSPTIQAMAEEVSGAYLQQLREVGVQNLAVVIAETKSGKIRAWVGSGDFHDSQHGGQVDGVTAPRSSGSILKPFLYALTLDRGAMVPETVIPDVPMRFGRFEPVNATHSYRGVVTLHDALVNSLNIPAVYTLHRFGVDPFYAFLKEAGVTTLNRRPAHYGLSLIVGGAETTLLDMTALYRSLGREGLFAPLTYLEGEGTAPSRRLLSPGASYLILNVLKDLRRPGWEYASVLMPRANPLAWKTGTSFRQRDAWAMGVSPDWTIGVWVGNFTGEGNTNLMGSRSAGPLLFQIYQRLEKRHGWFSEPVWDLKSVRVCSDTGYAATAACPHVRNVLAPVDAPPLKPCPYHHEYHVDPGTGRAVCSLCWRTGHVKEVSRLIYPPRVAAVLRNRGLPVDDPPSHNPSCPAFRDLHLIQFIYPVAGSGIYQPRDYNGKVEKTVFRVAHAERHSRLTWFIDGSVVGRTRDDHRLALLLSPGPHRLDVVDANGHAGRITFTVYRSRRRASLRKNTPSCPPVRPAG